MGRDRHVKVERGNREHTIFVVSVLDCESDGGADLYRDILRAEIVNLIHRVSLYYRYRYFLRTDARSWLQEHVGASPNNDHQQDDYEHDLHPRQPKSHLFHRSRSQE